jgi:glycosyltransferase involved in cell wall biosynthesis
MNFSKAHIIQIEEADIIHLHWVEGLLHGDFLEALLAKKEGTVFVTLHDMRPFTGGCHYSADCQGFTSGCSSCPIVRPVFQSFVANKFEFRNEFLKRLKPVFVSPGQWMKERFLESSIRDLPCYVVPNVVSEGFFAKLEKPKRGGPLILGFMAAKLTDPRKGLEIARKQIHRLAGSGIELNFQLVGASPPADLASWEKYKGILEGKDVPDWLSELDFLVFTSLSDNAPLVVAEALAAGTPILIAEGTGADHMVSLGQDSLDVFNATIDELREEQLGRNLSKGAMTSAVPYGPSHVARRIVDLYESKISR